MMSIERPNLDDWEPPEEIRVPPSLRDPRIHVTRQGLPLSGVILPSLCPMSPADTAGLLVQQHILLLTTRHSYPQAWSCPCSPFFGDSQHPLACNRLGKNMSCPFQRCIHPTKVTRAPRMTPTRCGDHSSLALHKAAFDRHRPHKHAKHQPSAHSAFTLAVPYAPFLSFWRRQTVQGG